ncbi:hypothetical protein P168DRAFT_304150 [Aspergillus campestris IBT 28561]|uniref:Uncharacterized protein n=1 Tax=Aspergillus campestris (strain IBT 28561) TaxID=1392248 RepID=A0A2I1D5C1_ASPC2|nr:uncharacterized protein P168DRAFT_304150 [Aspergillus campestris IBT 28561]PKY05069.1 hypothetical protein P168DRAFT_304150 [Aspergillus campestris IBT 28561]
MRMTWNGDSNAKLFLGVLSQIKDHKLKLDYKELSEYMGPECSVRAVQQQIDKLRKQVEEQDGAANGDAATSPKPSTPSKRKYGKDNGTPGTPSKKTKGGQEKGTA